MTDKLSLNKNTTISVSLVITLIIAAFSLGVLNAQTKRNSDDIDAVLTKMDTYLAANSDVSAKMATLNGRLDNFSDRLDQFNIRLEGLRTQQTGVSVQVPRPTPQLTVRQQPQTQTIVLQPHNPNSPKKSSPPAEQPQEPQPTIIGQLTDVTCHQLNILCRRP